MLRLHLDESSLNLVESYFPCMGILYPRWFQCVATLRTTDVQPFCSVFTASHTTCSASHAWMQPSQLPQERNTVLSTSFYSRGNCLCAGAACPRSWSEPLAWGTGSNWPIDCILTAQQCLWALIWKAQTHRTRGKGTAQRNNIKISGRKQKIQRRHPS